MAIGSTEQQPRYLYRSPLPDTVLASPRDITDALFTGRPDLDRNQKALIDAPTGYTLTYGQLIDRYETLSRALVGKLGLVEGDVICYLSPNSVEEVVFFYACFRSGIATSGISTLNTAEEVAFQLKDTSAKYILVHSDYLDRARQAIEKHKLGVQIILLEKSGKLAGGNAGLLTVADLVEAGSKLPALPPVDKSRSDTDLGDRTADIFYSSGTTGRPKGVVQSQENIIAAFQAIVRMEEGLMIPGKDVMLCSLPLYHIFAKNKVLHPCMFKGITVVILPAYAFEPFLAAIPKYKITRLAVVPPQAIQLVKDPLVDKYDTETIRYITSGAAVLGREMHEALFAKFGVLVKQGYGLTEATSSVCMTPAEGHPIYGSVGVLLPSFTAWIRNPETNESLPPNTPGEIMLKGPSVVKKYLNRPDASSEAFQGGFLATGDIGYVDDLGNWFISDRIKEMIKTNGLQVPPAEIEDLVLQSTPDIVECAVVPAPHEKAGQIPVAYVVLRSTSSQKEAIVKATKFLEEKVARYKIPRTWRVVEQLNKTASGKIQRRAMADLESSGYWEKQQAKAKL